MQRPHLAAALAATLILLGAVTGAARYAEAREAGTAVAVAADPFAQKDLGRALQVAAAQRPDLLLVYGSSDLNHGGDWRAGPLFAGAPTGFAAFEVGGKGATPIVYAQRVAALGPAARGARIALTLSPEQYLGELATQEQGFFAGNFSPLDANEAAFSPDLSAGLKRDLARRLLDFPQPIARDPLLAFALRRLAGDTLPDRALYLAAYPLGRLRVAILRLQDHWETVTYLRRHAPPAPPARPRPLNWLAAEQQAARIQVRRAADNPYGFDDVYWRSHRKQLTDAVWQRRLAEEAGQPRAEADWADLELLLRMLSELGAHPLLLSPPLRGDFYDAIGVPRTTRDAYYTRLEALAGRYGADVRDFRDHDADRYFDENLASHPSVLGWAYYDAALDAFAHDRPLETAAAPGGAAAR